MPKPAGTPQPQTRRQGRSPRKTLRATSILTIDHRDAVAILDEAVERIAHASIAGNEPGHALKEGSARLDRIRAYLKRDDEIIVVRPPQPPGEPLPRMTPGLRLLNLQHHPDRDELLARTAIERKEFASVPSFLCCLAAPDSQVRPAPEQWLAWARIHNAPGADVCLKVTNLTIDRWAMWGRAQGIEIPVRHHYIRESGTYRLEMYSSPTFGCPYGIYFSDLMIGIATYVQQLKNRGLDTRTIHFGDTFNDGIKRLLGVDYLSGGKNGNGTRFTHQFHATINSHILFWRQKDRIHDYVRYDFADPSQALPTEIEKHLLWRAKRNGMTITLGDAFHRDCLRAAPFDHGIYRLLRRRGPLPAKIFLWLNLSAYKLKQQRRDQMSPLSWPLLKVQFGTDTSTLRLFRTKFIEALNLVAAAYPEMSWTETSHGRTKLEEYALITLREPSVRCAYVGFPAASGTDGRPVFRGPRQESGDLF